MGCHFKVPVDVLLSCRKDDVLMAPELTSWCQDTSKGIRNCSLFLTEPSPGVAPIYAEGGTAYIGQLLSLPNAHVEEKRLTFDFLRSAVSNMPEPCRYVVSGPSAFNASIREMLTQLAVDKNAITILAA